VQHDEEDELSTADMAAAGARPVPGQEAKRVPGQEVKREIGRPEARKEEPRAAAGAAPPPSAPLFHEPDARDMRDRWDTIQTAFVDNPRQAVEQADHLVAQTIKRLADMFAQERSQLEQQWSRGGDVSTEDLRIALQRYRSFFGRLLSV